MSAGEWILLSNWELLAEALFAGDADPLDQQADTTIKRAADSGRRHWLQHRHGQEGSAHLPPQAHQEPAQGMRRIADMRT